LPERPTGRRMVLAGVVIPSRKRPRSDMSLDDDIAGPSSSSSLPESRSMPKPTVRYDEENGECGTSVTLTMSFHHFRRATFDRVCRGPFFH
jgi:hypothetical protein